MTLYSIVNRQAVFFILCIVSLWPFAEEYIIVWHPTSTFAFFLKVTIRNSYLAPQYHLPGLFVWDLVSQQVPSSYVVWRYASVSSENVSLAFNTFQRIASQRSTFILVFVPWLNIVVILSLQKKKKNQLLFYNIILSHFWTQRQKCTVLIRIKLQVNNLKDKIHRHLLQF